LAFATQAKGGNLTEDEELAMAISQSLQDPGTSDAAAAAAASVGDHSGGGSSVPQRTAPPQAPLLHGVCADTEAYGLADNTWTSLGRTLPKFLACAMIDLCKSNQHSAIDNYSAMRQLV
jgi:hypothetical protein